MRASSVLFVVALCLVQTGAWAQDCTVSAAGVSFGAYDPLGMAATDGTGQVQVRCSSGLPFRIFLGPGRSSPAAPQQRTMRSDGSGGQLFYNLYLDASRTLVWGDGTGTSQVQAGQGTGQPQVLTIYGRVPPGQNVPVGSFSDTVTVTVLW